MVRPESHTRDVEHFADVEALVTIYLSLARRERLTLLALASLDADPTAAEIIGTDVGDRLAAVSLSKNGYTSPYAQLRALEDQGLIDSRSGERHPTKHYTLTDRGREFLAATGLERTVALLVSVFGDDYPLFSPLCPHKASENAICAIITCHHH